MRPANFPSQTPGLGYKTFDSKKGRVLVINIMGRLFMDPLDDPFRIIDDILTKNELGKDNDAIIIDMHAEATSEKVALGHFCDGSHSYLAEAMFSAKDENIPCKQELRKTTNGYPKDQILPFGTGYQTDAGMCGDYDSVIGMEKTEPLRRFVEKTPGNRFSPAQGEPTLCGVIIETDEKGLCHSIEPLRVGGVLSNTDESK